MYAKLVFLGETCKRSDGRREQCECENEELKWKPSQRPRFVEFNQNSEQRGLRIELRL